LVVAKNIDLVKYLKISNLQGLFRAPGGATNYLIEVFNNQIDISLSENFTETILKQFWQLVSLFGGLWHFVFIILYRM